MLVWRPNTEFDKYLRQISQISKTNMGHNMVRILHWRLSGGCLLNFTHIAYIKDKYDEYQRQIWGSSWLGYYIHWRLSGGRMLNLTNITNINDKYEKEKDKYEATRIQHWRLSGDQALKSTFTHTWYLCMCNICIISDPVNDRLSCHMPHEKEIYLYIFL